MREIHLRWSAQTVAASEYAPIASIAHNLEVVGHLDIGENGIRQLISPTFCDGKGPDDLDEVPFLKVDTVLGKEKGGTLWFGIRILSRWQQSNSQTSTFSHPTPTEVKGFQSRSGASQAEFRNS